MADEPQDESFADILGTPTPFPTATPLTTFKPWHRPRKHFIRRAQWAREITFLARDLDLTETELRYLTLPGSDLLDIRHLHDSVCVPRNVQLRYLGFNTEAKPESDGQAALNSAEFSIKRLPNVDTESLVFPGDFRDLSDQKSKSAQAVRAMDPFHAINLDLCGGFAGPHKVSGMGNYFAALEWVLRNQSNVSHDFLLFITTRIDEKSTDPEHAKALGERLKALREYCEEFGLAVDSAWPSPATEDGSTPDPLSGATQEEQFMLGLTQFVVARGVGFGLKGRVQSLMSYTTGDGTAEDDIVSVAIRFSPDPHIAPDPDGLIKTPTPVKSVDTRECEQSAPIPSRIVKRVRVDQQLRQNTAEMERCTAESSALLVSAGYDEAAYQKWVAADPLHA